MLVITVLVLFCLTMTAPAAIAQQSHEDENTSQGTSVSVSESEGSNMGFGLGLSLGVGESYSYSMGSSDGEFAGFTVTGNDGHVTVTAFSGGERFSLNMPSGAYDEMLREQELQNEMRNREFEQLWRNLELEEQRRVSEWERIMADFAHLSMLDFDEAAFNNMSNALIAASNEFEVKHGITMVMISNALYTFWKNHAEAEQTIDDFFDVFWAENNDTRVKLDRFFDTFETQNVLIQGNLYAMQKYVDSRISAMGIGSGYGFGVTEYVAPAQEASAPTGIDAGTVNYIIVYLTIAVLLGVLMFVIISRKMKGGRYHQ